MHPAARAVLSMVLLTAACDSPSQNHEIVSYDTEADPDGSETFYEYAVYRRR